MKIRLLWAASVIAITTLGCGHAYEKPETAYDSSATDTTDAGTNLSSSAALDRDSTRQFIRTADLQFRVKDVRLATLAIEDITSHFEGFVTFTKLSSTINQTTTTPISADSLLETIHYTVSNDITLRVPNTKLDSTLRTLSVYIDFLDSRTISAQDVSLSVLANKMAQKRLEKNTGRLTTAIDRRGKKLDETSKAEDILLDNQEKADNAQLSTLNLQEQIAYSTINLHIYQRQSIKRTLIENQKNINAYQPSFFTQAGSSIVSGWNGLKILIIGLVMLWPLFLGGGIIWLMVKRFWGKKPRP